MDEDVDKYLIMFVNDTFIFIYAFQQVTSEISVT